MEGSSSPSAVPQTPVADSVPRILLVDDADQVKDRKPPPEYQRAIAIEVWREEPNLAKIRRLLQQYDLNLLLYDAESGNSTVHRFAFLGCLDLLRLVLNDPESKIDGRNTLSRTPLHIACEKNHKAIAEELLSRKADANAVTSGGSTPLHFACRAEAVGVVELLLRQPDIVVDQEDNSRRTPLQTTGHEAIVAKLQEHIDSKLDLDEFGV